MKNLEKFQKTELTTVQQQKTKGGLRFVTSCRDTYRAKRSELRDLGYDIETEQCNTTSHYCIEW